MQEQYLAVGETFNFQEVVVKGEREHYITGYISTKSIDKFNDLITDECLEDMLIQIKSGSIKIDFEHETIHESNLDKNPIARIVEAKKDHKGIWVKAMLNLANGRFKEVWASIKNGFLDSFSIAFKPIETATRYIQGKAVRILNKLRLVNVGITGTPVNEECRLDKVIVKAIREMETKVEEDNLLNKIKEVEEKSLNTQCGLLGNSNSTLQKGDNKKMVEETKPVETTEAVQEEVKTEEVKIEAVKPSQEKSKVGEVTENAEVKALQDELAEVKALLAEVKKQLAKPELKAIQEAPQITKLKENVTPLGLIG